MKFDLCRRAMGTMNENFPKKRNLQNNLAKSLIFFFDFLKNVRTKNLKHLHKVFEQK
jgi:hypothetical protein